MHTTENGFVTDSFAGTLSLVSVAFGVGPSAMEIDNYVVVSKLDQTALSHSLDR